MERVRTEAILLWTIWPKTISSICRPRRTRQLSTLLKGFGTISKERSWTCYWSLAKTRPMQTFIKSFTTPHRQSTTTNSWGPRCSIIIDMYNNWSRAPIKKVLKSLVLVNPNDWNSRVLEPVFRIPCSYSSTCGHRNLLASNLIPIDWLFVSLTLQYRVYCCFKTLMSQ